MEKNIIIAKNLLLEKNCFECKYAIEIWRLADGNIKCNRTRRVYNISHTCHRWKKPQTADVVMERNYYKNKYIRGKESWARTNNILKRIIEAANENMDKKTS